MEFKSELQFQIINTLWGSKHFLKWQQIKANVIFRANYFGICYSPAVYNNHPIHHILRELVLEISHWRCEMLLLWPITGSHGAGHRRHTVLFCRHCQHMVWQQWQDASSRHFPWLQWMGCPLDTFIQQVRAQWEVATEKSALLFQISETLVTLFYRRTSTLYITCFIQSRLHLSQSFRHVKKKTCNFLCNFSDHGEDIESVIFINKYDPVQHYIIISLFASRKYWYTLVKS